jgi:hypothetical protein
MNEEENNFESLRRALALKRHEIPPPGYFENFSSEVRARIRNGEADEQTTFASRLFDKAPWLLQFLQSFETKPAFAGAFASALCLVLLGGIIYAERPDGAESALAVIPGTNPQPMSPLASLSAGDLMPASETAGLSATTNPVFSLQPVSSFFGQPNPLIQPVSFSPSGN